MSTLIGDEFRLVCHVQATEIDPPEDWSYPWRLTRGRAVADARTDGPNRNPRRDRWIEIRPQGQTEGGA